MSEKNYITSANAVTIRLRIKNKPGGLAAVTAAIAEMGGNLGAIDIVRVEQEHLIRDLTIDTAGDEHVTQIMDRLRSLPGIEVIHVSDRTFLMHLGGKIEVRSKTRIKTRAQLSMAYTPGVARVCQAIHGDPERVFNLTIKSNTVAVVSDGTAVLGLGDIGPEAAIPVMEGKAQLFKEFGGVDAFPICLATKDVEEIVQTVKLIAPVFGGINLEDISAPRCFAIERRLKEELDIPVFHDDQHGTAVVTTAALINALKIVGKKPEDLRVVVVGTGAAGTACTEMLLHMGVTEIIGFDRHGALARSMPDLPYEKRRYAEMTNPNEETGPLGELIAGADVFIGVAGPGVLTVDDVKKMARDPIVFALANPEPEIRPEEVYGHVAVIATGRSDYPNQINNVLCFPGLFKGALEVRARDVNEEMKLAAAIAIAEAVHEDALSPEYVIPSVFDRNVVTQVAEAVKRAAIETGVARKAP
jgi:malate dehydrogenase (oxaloacetate-decarboxylating)